MDVNDMCRFCKFNLKVGGRITNSKLLFQDATRTSTDVSTTLASLGLPVAHTPLRSFRICRKCFAWVTKFKIDMDKFCEWKKQEESEEGANVSSTDTTPRTMKARRLTEAPARTSETEVLIKYKNEARRFKCQQDVTGVIESLAKRNFQRAAHLISANKDLMEEVKSVVLKVIDGECQDMCSRKNNFVLWRSSATDLVDFSFEKIHDDLKRLSPFLLGVISTIAKNSAPHICTAAAVALRGRSPGLSALSYYVDMVLLYGGAKKSAFTRLSKMGISTVHESAVAKQKEMAELCELPVSSLKGALEDFFSSESQVPVLTEDQSNTGEAHVRERTFARNLQLKLHKRSHQKAARVPRKTADALWERPYQCALCMKTFAHASELTAHGKSHRKAAPVSQKALRMAPQTNRSESYQCCQCDRTFGHKKGLWEHRKEAHQLRLHKGRRPFRCSTCGTSFWEELSLTRHQRVHTRAKPYRCRQCGRAALRISKHRCSADRHQEETQDCAPVCEETEDGAQDFYIETEDSAQDCEETQDGAPVCEETEDGAQDFYIETEDSAQDSYIETEDSTPACEETQGGVLVCEKTQDGAQDFYCKTEDSVQDFYIKTEDDAQD